MKDKLEREQSKPPKVEVRIKTEVEYEQRCKDCKKDTLDDTIRKYHFKKMAQQGMINGLFAYSLLITVLSAVRNKVVFGDLRAFCKQVGRFFKQTFMIIKMAVIWVSQQADKIPQPVVSVVLHWVAIILLSVIIIGLIAFGLFLVTVKAWKPIKRSFDNLALTVMLGFLALIVFLGDFIRAIIKFNLVWQYVTFITVFYLIRICIKHMRYRLF